jgi:glycosyltransferase involved in cell wall biosynthesis
VIKTPCYDLDAFANNILRLLEDKSLYQHLSNEARELIYTVWDNEKRSKELLNGLLSVMHKNNL